MSDVTQLSDEALVEKFSDSSYCKIEGWGDDSGYEPERTELLRRLALRDQQVTLAMVQEAVDGLIEAEMDSWRGRTDTSSRELYALASLSESCHECLPHLHPWPTPQQDGAG